MTLFSTIPLSDLQEICALFNSEQACFPYEQDWSFPTALNKSGRTDGSSQCVDRESPKSLFSFVDEGKSADSLPVSEDSGETALSTLMAMPGLAQVKAEIMRQLDYHRVMECRRKAGLRTPERIMNMILTGNPGCGKTTVARLIGRIYHGYGLLSNDCFVEVNRADLVGKYVGHSESNTREIIESASGGILFIDEMYALASPADNSDFGVRVIDTLMTELSGLKSSVMVIGAGYPDRMQGFLGQNPGLASRFPTILNFPDYSGAELLEIADSHLSEYGFVFDDEAREMFSRLINECKRMRDFGNARTVITAIDNHIIPNLCSRISSLTDGDMLSSVIIPADIPAFNDLMPFARPDRNKIGFRQ